MPKIKPSTPKPDAVLLLLARDGGDSDVADAIPIRFAPCPRCAEPLLVIEADCEHTGVWGWMVAVDDGVCFVAHECDGVQEEVDDAN